MVSWPTALGLLWAEHHGGSAWSNKIAYLMAVEREKERLREREEEEKEEEEKEEEEE
jgi:hypothetical protein